MKTLLFTLLIAVSIVGFSQEPFEKDGKWGLSKNGDAEDSVIFRADYDEIDMIVCTDGYFPIGLKGKEWYPLTSNKLLNQQGYEEISMPDFLSNLIVAKRDGYIDIIDLVLTDFLIRNVQATALVDEEVYNLPSNYLMTINDKSFGLVSIVDKKELLKAKYTSILPDQENSESAWLFAREEGKTSVFDSKGTLLYELISEEEVVSMIQEDKDSKLYKVSTIEGKYGMYNSAEKWLVDPIYIDVMPFIGSEEVVVVTAKKGEGIFFNGKMLLEPVYMDVIKSSERGYIAQVSNKKGEFLVDPNGKLTPVSEE
ncbi:MAG: hypothetical protein ACI857_000416 [Arenicella sp.]|jgi:hypothetical protein